MALHIPHSIFHLARLLYVRPETFGPYNVLIIFLVYNSCLFNTKTSKNLKALSISSQAIDELGNVLPLQVNKQAMQFYRCNTKWIYDKMH